MQCNVTRAYYFWVFFLVTIEVKRFSTTSSTSSLESIELRSESEKENDATLISHKSNYWKNNVLRTTRHRFSKNSFELNNNFDPKMIDLGHYGMYSQQDF